MSAKAGWRVHEEVEGICASMRTADGGDLYTMKGFATRHEAWLFIAAFTVLLAKNDEGNSAKQMIDTFLRSKSTH